jgi:hypothetical protein
MLACFGTVLPVLAEMDIISLAAQGVLSCASYIDVVKKMLAAGHGLVPPPSQKVPDGDAKGFDQIQSSDSSTRPN